jgi:hypothetical protein
VLIESSNYQWWARSKGTALTSSSSNRHAVQRAARARRRRNAIIAPAEVVMKLRSQAKDGCGGVRLEYERKVVPSWDRRGGCASRKSREATSESADGVVILD